MTFYRFARAVVLTPCKAVFRVHVVGGQRIPSSGPYIVAPTHRSIFDIPFAAFVTKRRIRFMAKRELFASRFGGWLFRKLGAIQVERDATDRGALRASRAALEAGEPLGVFPEGTRRSGAEVVDLYDGVAYLALKLGVPIIPVGVGGSEEILPSGKVLPRLHKVAVVVGEPIHVGSAGPGGAGGAEGRVRRRSEVVRITEQLQEHLQACFDEARTLAGVPVGAPTSSAAKP